MSAIVIRVQKALDAQILLVAILVMILTNVPPMRITAIEELNAKILAVPTSVTAAMDIKVSPLLYAQIRRTFVLLGRQV